MSLLPPEIRGPLLPEIGGPSPLQEEGACGEGLEKWISSSQF